MKLKSERAVYENRIVVFMDILEVSTFSDSIVMKYRSAIMPYKGQLEAWYTKHRTVSMYFTIIFMTVEAVLNPGSKSWKKLKEIPELPDNLRDVLLAVFVNRAVL